ncbi:hypothetical protein [Magnetospirillum fulvum]|uniref:Large polyvalent protein associated domain-containing protein n=1 Tax=Magnetospirillum fulvum MGU-K5 TaxID=1316936 RepID=S9SH84_MAGFU|nr:hypothetical protein [Magnetospirillum fulvum]EPY03483.1 hypothetical protein K678_00190 [Magnetospirillum fulvum MGU-K5]
MAEFDPALADQTLAGSPLSSQAPATSFDPAAADATLAGELRSRLSGSARDAVAASPDTTARAVSLSRQSGMPIGAVLADLPEFEAREIADRFWSAPEATRAFLADPTNAALAKDDIASLARLEDSWGRVLGKAIANVPQQWRSAAGGVLEMFGRNDVSVLGAQMRALKALEADPSLKAEDAIKAELERDPTFAAGKRLRDSAQAAMKANASNVDPWSAKGLVGDIVGGATNMIPAIAAGIATRSPVVGAGVIGGQVLGEQYGDSIDKGRSSNQALVDSLFFAAAEAIPETIPMGALLEGGGKALLSRMGKSAVAEGAQEMVTEVLQRAYSAGVIGEEMTFGQAVEAVVRSGIVGAGVGGGLSVATHPFVRDRAGVDQARETAAALTEAVAATQESKLATRDPERFADLVRQIAGDGQLHIPAASLQSLYQSGVIDDATLDGFDVTAQLPEALAAGGDVLVDPAKYLAAASKLTPEALAQVIGSTRRGATDMTMKEVEAFLADGSERRKDVTDLMESLSIQYEGAKPGQIVEDEVTQALMKTGRYTESQAKAQAVLWRERMIQRGADRGIDPDALWLEEKPRILGPAPRLPVDDIDLVLERIRSGNEVTPPRQPVLDIFRHLGGVKPGSTLAQELAAMGITPKEAPGLFRRTGIGSADQVVVSEHEVLRDNQVKADNSGNGYADHDALMQAVAKEWAGDPLQTQADRTGQRGLMPRSATCARRWRQRGSSRSSRPRKMCCG